MGWFTVTLSVPQLMSKQFLLKSILRVLINSTLQALSSRGRKCWQSQILLDLSCIFTEHVVSPNLLHLIIRIKYQEAFCWQVFRLQFSEHPNFFWSQTIKRFLLNSSFPKLSSSLCQHNTCCCIVSWIREDLVEQYLFMNRYFSFLSQFITQM